MSYSFPNVYNFKIQDFLLDYQKLRLFFQYSRKNKLYKYIDTIHMYVLHVLFSTQTKLTLKQLTVYSYICTRVYLNETIFVTDILVKAIWSYASNVLAV